MTYAYYQENKDDLYKQVYSLRYSSNDIKSLNNIINNTLSIGQELKIPRWIFNKTKNIIKYHYMW